MRRNQMGWSRQRGPAASVEQLAGYCYDKVAGIKLFGQRQLADTLWDKSWSRVFVPWFMCIYVHVYVPVCMYLCMCMCVRVCVCVLNWIDSNMDMCMMGEEYRSHGRAVSRSSSTRLASRLASPAEPLRDLSESLSLLSDLESTRWHNTSWLPLHSELTVGVKIRRN